MPKYILIEKLILKALPIVYKSPLRYNLKMASGKPKYVIDVF